MIYVRIVFERMQLCTHTRSSIYSEVLEYSGVTLPWNIKPNNRPHSSIWLREKLNIPCAVLYPHLSVFNGDGATAVEARACLHNAHNYLTPKNTMDDKLDIESQAPVVPLNPSRFIRNRFLFAIFDICLLLINSFWAHGRVSREIIAVPSIELVPFARKLENSTKIYSDALLARIDADNAVINTAINATLEREINRTGTLTSLNADKVRSRLDDERTVRYSYHQQVTYLQAWSRVGNEVPYFPNATDEDTFFLQTMLNLENGAIIEELAGESITLSDQLAARYEYDVEYLQNKTSGLLPTLIPDIAASLHIPDLDVNIRERVVRVYDELIAELRPVRDYIAEVYQSLSLQLLETELAFEAVAVNYDALISTVRRFYEILDSINVIGLDSSLFPRVDLDSFPTPNFYLPESMTFPALDVFLKPFDDVLLRLEAPFDLLASDIFSLVDLSMDVKADEIVAAVIDALTPDDYFPPSIEFQGRSLSLPDALALNNEITANLTLQATQLPNPKFVTEVPDFSVPDVSFEPQSFDFARPVADLFSWSIPNLLPFVSVLREIIMFLWRNYIKVEVFVINIYRAMRRAHEYFEGTAVPLPVIDLRTKAEQEDGVERKESKCKAISNYVFHPLIGTVITQLLPFVFFSAFVFAGYSYYVGEFHPNCVMSNTGTSMGRFAVGPFLYNRALAAGQQHALDLSIQNHLYVQEKCQIESMITYDAYRRQVVAFEGSRIKTVRDLKGISTIGGVVDLHALCEQHERACSGEDPNMICPILENGSIVGNPCEFAPTNTQMITSSLEAVDFSCSSVPRGELSLNGTRDQVQKELLVEENWCVVEWWFLGHLWRFAYVISGYFILLMAFRWTIDGLHTYFWNKLRPEWWHIQCTADRNGVFTQPEYSDQEAKAQAIREWQFGHNCIGVIKLLIGLGMLAGWVVISLRTWRLTMEPSWYSQIVGIAES